MRAVSNQNGDVVKEIVYDTFGNILDDSNETLKVPFGFAGGLYDIDTKLIHFGFREYDPFIGRWTAKDPILFAGGDSNLYGYVLGDPVGGIDPEGLWTMVITNGATTRISIKDMVFRIGNPFGHSAIAFTKSGIYSFGNGTAINSNVIDYLIRESKRRDTLLQILNTTPNQERIMKSYLNSLKNKLEWWPDNCATRTSNALYVAGINNILTGFPEHLRFQLDVIHKPIRIFIPKGKAIEVIKKYKNFIESFNP